ncbi:hypothetical protein ACOSQ4_027914 [Xanthoceras sorbifolium]
MILRTISGFFEEPFWVRSKNPDLGSSKNLLPEGSSSGFDRRTFLGSSTNPVSGFFIKPRRVRTKNPSGFDESNPETGFFEEPRWVREIEEKSKKLRVEEEMREKIDEKDKDYWIEEES